MAVCSFLGHHMHIYDRDILPRLADAAEKVVRENDTVDFLLLMSPGLSLSPLFLRVSLEMKTRYPSKVTITVLMQSQEEYQNYTLQKHIPPCMADRVVVAPAFAAKPDTSSLSSLSRWMIQQSTHLICYLYERFYEPVDWDLYYAKRQPGLEIFDITSEETARLIEDTIRAMPDREQLIFQKLGEGCTLKEIGRMLGLVGSERVRQIRAKASSEMSRAVIASVFSQSSRTRRRPLICGIFALGDSASDISYQTGLSFEHALEYLKEKFGVTQFKIAAEYDSSMYMYILRRFQKRPGMADVQITLVTTGDMDSDSDVALDGYSVENIDTTFSAGDPALEMIRHLMAQSDFCICNLAGPDPVEEIRKYAAQSADVILLDIGRTNICFSDCP